MKLYISGAMSAYGPEGNYGFHNFNEAARRLLAAGYEVENPADNGVIDGWTWGMYIKYDLKLMLECDGVALLPDWPMSQGAQLEKYVAEKCELQVRTLEEWIALDRVVA